MVVLVSRKCRVGVLVAVVLCSSLLGAPRLRAQVTSGFGEDGKQLYEAACATCHAVNGEGASKEHVGFEEALPDFTDCRFAAREPSADWLGVVHEGGPTRSFSKMMPSFGAALTQDEQQLIVRYVRGFCTDDRWPRGELNLPRALVTEKAFPEDEAVLEMGGAVEGETDFSGALIFEKRFGPRNQIELKVPFGWLERPAPAGGSQHEAGLGDIALGLKRTLFHSYSQGRIFSATAEVVVPTGDQDEGHGKGYTVFEPFLTFGQLLPGDGFLHLQAGLELPVNKSSASEEAFLRAALGRTWSATQFGRAWSPIVEVLASRSLDSSGSLQWDVVPQFQVALNNRQHVLANLGVRIPIDDRGQRDTQVLFYILWDWFDGGLLDGW